MLEELKANQKKYEQMPKGVYTGFKTEKEVCPDDGIIALLGYPARPSKATEHQYQTYDLIYIDMNGKPDSVAMALAK